MKSQIYNFVKNLNDLVKIHIKNDFAIIKERLQNNEKIHGDKSLSVHFDRVQNEMYRKLLKHFQVHPENCDPIIIENVNWVEKIAVRFLSENIDVIDVGCGLGGYGKRFSQKNSILKSWKYLGIEPSDELIHMCRSFFPEGKFNVGDVFHSSLPDHAFDLVMMSGVLQCLGDQWEHALKESIRLTRKYIMILRLAMVENEVTFSYKITLKSKDMTAEKQLRVFNIGEFYQALHKMNLHVVDHEITNESVFIRGCKNRIPMHRFLLELCG